MSLEGEVTHEEDQLQKYYDRFYYETYAFGQAYRADNAHWRTFFDAIAKTIVQELAPKSALDAGCGPGLLVGALRDHGVDAWGIDISDYAIEHAREDVRPYCRVASVTDDLDRDFDLIICIEVLEHLPRRLAHRAVTVLASHTGDVLFSSAPNDFFDPSHQNAQPSEYWIGLFARHSFFRDFGFDASFISRHAVRLRRFEKITLDLIREYERWYSRVLEQLNEMRSTNLGIVEDRARLTAEVERLNAENESLSASIERHEDLRSSLAAAEDELRRYRGLEQGKAWKLARSAVAARARFRRRH